MTAVFTSYSTTTYAAPPKEDEPGLLDRATGYVLDKVENSDHAPEWLKKEAQKKRCQPLARNTVSEFNDAWETSSSLSLPARGQRFTSLWIFGLLTVIALKLMKHRGALVFTAVSYLVLLSCLRIALWSAEVTPQVQASYQAYADSCSKFDILEVADATILDEASDEVSGQVTDPLKKRWNKWRGKESKEGEEPNFFEKGPMMVCRSVAFSDMEAPTWWTHWGVGLVLMLVSALVHFTWWRGLKRALSISFMEAVFYVWSLTSHVEKKEVKGVKTDNVETPVTEPGEGAREPTTEGGGASAPAAAATSEAEPPATSPPTPGLRLVPPLTEGAEAPAPPDVEDTEGYVRKIPNWIFGRVIICVRCKVMNPEIRQQCRACGTNLKTGSLASLDF